VTEPLLDRLLEVAREIGAASHLLLCLDFGGTLAPVVPDPVDAGRNVILAGTMPSK
jgi:hypothetical protein